MRKKEEKEEQGRNKVSKEKDLRTSAAQQEYWRTLDALN